MRTTYDEVIWACNLAGPLLFLSIDEIIKRVIADVFQIDREPDTHPPNWMREEYLVKLFKSYQTENSARTRGAQRGVRWVIFVADIIADVVKEVEILWRNDVEIVRRDREFRIRGVLKDTDISTREKARAWLERSFEEYLR